MLGVRLKYLRKSNNKTQQDLADILGITRPAYTAYEQGKRNPDYGILEKIADYYNVSVDYLLGRTDKVDMSTDKVYPQPDSSIGRYDINETTSKYYKSNEISSISQRLKELRKEAKLTQAEVATLLNISESAYGYYEQGRNEISISSIQTLAEKYDVSVAYIMCETNERQPFDKDEAAFQAFANDPELQVFYKELPKSNEEIVRRLRDIWEIIKHDKK